MNLLEPAQVQVCPRRRLRYLPDATCPPANDPPFGASVAFVWDAYHTAPEVAGW